MELLGETVDAEDPRLVGDIAVKGAAKVDDDRLVGADAAIARSLADGGGQPHAAQGGVAVGGGGTVGAGGDLAVKELAVIGAHADDAGVALAAGAVLEFGREFEFGHADLDDLLGALMNAVDLQGAVFDDGDFIVGFDGAHPANQIGGVARCCLREDFADALKKIDGEDIELHAELLRQRYAETLQEPGEVLGALERDDLLESRFHPRPAEILADKVEGLAGHGDIKNSLLDGAGKVEEVGILHHDDSVEALLLH